MKKLQPIIVVCAAGLLLAGCAARVPAPVVDRSPKPSAQAAPAPAEGVPAGHYVVKRGDTLYSIALEHGADYRDVAQWNGLDDPTRLTVGQMLRVTPPEPRPGVTVGAARGIGRLEARPIESVPQQARAESRVKTEPKALRLPYSRENLAMLSREEARAQDPEAIEFIWPVKGKVLTAFAEPRSKGIDIDGKLGDPVVAAAAGRVTYIGTGIPGLGKLVVIKHDNGFSTVYAHNKDIVVKEQQSVARGQKIAELGATDADRPKLHFQIRKGSAPVDPLRYLPGS